MQSKDALNIHRNNINEFDRRIRISKAQRRNSADMLADLLISGNGAPRDRYREFRGALRTASPRDKAGFCLALFEGHRDGNAALGAMHTGGDTVPAGAHGRIALVRNQYNEAAYTAFSRLVNGAKKVYSPSFVSACESVFDGDCQFCILPTEGSQNGKMFGFYSAIDRYEMKICAACEIDADGSSEGVKYALVGRSAPDRIPKGLSRCFEFSVISDTGMLLADILEAASVFGAELSGIDSLPVEYRDGLQKYYLTFRLSGDDIRGLDLYLSEEYASYAPIGYYPLTGRI